MFLGEFDHSVDVKGRVAVPAKFRPQLETGLVITRGLDRCLWVYPMEEWQALSQRISAQSVAQPEARQLRRQLFGNAFDTELDKQGRILVPAPLRTYAGIGEGAVVAGMNTYFEIWAKDAWELNQAGIAEEASAIAATLANLGL